MFNVRKTSYLHIGSHRDTEKIKLVLRWMMNKPKGNLKLEDLKFEDMVNAYEADSEEDTS